jgi:TM2 domain-containing membrane protein YozV/predicted transcriptional regulator
VYSTGLAYLLWLISGFGVLGFHRFYLGKVGTGLLYIITGGLFGIGSLYDLITLPLQVREANLQLGYRNALLQHYQHQAAPGNQPAREVGQKERKRETLEQVILRTAKHNDGICTPSEVALESGRNIDEAKTALDTLAEKGYTEVRVRKNGGIVYFFRDFARNGEDPGLEDF